MTENLRTHHFVTEKPVHHSRWTTIPLPASTSSSGPDTEELAPWERLIPKNK